MSIYACRNCRAVDDFVSYESIPARRSYITRIEDLGGERVPVFSGEFEEIGDTDDPLYACVACGAEAYNLDELVEKVA
jgi:hypothetical protein